VKVFLPGRPTCASAKCPQLFLENRLMHQAIIIVRTMAVNNRKYV
jgi:hypothetical protein